MQPGDALITCAESKGLEEGFEFIPPVDMLSGLRKFAEWYKDNYLICSD